LPQGSAPTRFARKEFFPQGWESSVSQFLELFHRYGYIYRPLGDGNWSSANETWKLDDSSILKAIALKNKKYYVGTRSGRKTRYAVLDIDAHSRYHSQEELDRLLQTLSAAGLSRSSLFRSSFSDGWHLYIFFDEQILSTILYQQLTKLLRLNDFEVSKGTLEVFPHPGYASLGMGLRLPLQSGWAWLDKRTLEVDCYREEVSATKALEMFLDVLDADSNSYADFLALRARVHELELVKAATSTTPAVEKSNNVVPLRQVEKSFAASEFSVFVASIFGHMPLNMNAEDWHKGRLFHLQGLTSHSQRAEAAFCLGHYFFYGDPSRGLPALGYAAIENRETLIQKFLANNHNGFSKDISRGQVDATAQITRMANWIPPDKRDGDVQTYTTTRPISWIKGNEKRRTNARQRIQVALAALQKRKRPFTTVELQKAAGCARDTLYKHSDIWRQEYEDLAEDFFAICPGDHNAVEDFPSSEGLPFSPVLKEQTPIGLFAARQVVFELALKVKKDAQIKQQSVLEITQDLHQDWRFKVAQLTRQTPLELSVKQLKSRLFVLANLLTIAPYEEDAVALLLYLQQVRFEFRNRCRGPKSLVTKDSDDLEDSS